MPPDDDPQTIEVDDDAYDEPPLDQDYIHYEAVERQNRLWLKAVLPLLQTRDLDGPNPRVQFALDRMRIAACERAARILASDLPSVEST